MTLCTSKNCAAADYLTATTLTPVCTHVETRIIVNGDESKDHHDSGTSIGCLSGGIK